MAAKRKTAKSRKKRAYVRKEPYVKPEITGRPPHVPTPALRAIVKMALTAGKTHEQVCEYLELGSVNTFKEHYADEIRKTKFEMDSLVVQTAFQMATGGALTIGPEGKSTGRWQDAVPAMTKLYLTTRLDGAFKETVAHEHGGKDGMKEIVLKIDRADENV